MESGGGESDELLRIGAGREFETEAGPLIPFLALDFLDGEIITVFSLGLGFEL